jgi:hypothetical protein
MLLKKCWPASTISSAENWSVAGGCVGINGAGWMAIGVGPVCAAAGATSTPATRRATATSRKVQSMECIAVSLAYTTRPNAHILSRRSKRTVILVDARFAPNMGRLDRLGSAKEVARIGAVIGRCRVAGTAVDGGGIAVRALLLPCLMTTLSNGNKRGYLSWDQRGHGEAVIRAVNALIGRQG